MIDKFMQWLGQDRAEQTELIDPKRAAAALLVEVLAADHQWSSSESDTLKAILASPSFGISSAEIEAYFLMAKADHADSNDVYRYTRSVNQSFDLAAKRQLLLALWQVAYADDQLDRYEEAMVRKLAELLHLPHQAFIETKLEAKAAKGL